MTATFYRLQCRMPGGQKAMNHKHSEMPPVPAACPAGLGSSRASMLLCKQQSHTSLRRRGLRKRDCRKDPGRSQWTGSTITLPEHHHPHTQLPEGDGVPVPQRQPETHCCLSLVWKEAPAKGSSAPSSRRLDTWSLVYRSQEWMPSILPQSARR